MKKIKEITGDIQKISLEQVTDIEALKQIHTLCKELEDKKEDVCNTLNGLYSDFNMMAQKAYKTEEDADNSDYKCLIAKRDAITTVLKIIEEL